MSIHEKLSNTLYIFSKYYLLNNIIKYVFI